MKRALQLAVVIAIAAILCSATEVIDRIVATVNRTPVTQSEWDDAVRLEALLEGREPGAENDAERKATLDRLIDQALITQQIHESSYTPVTDDVVAARIAELRRQVPQAGADAAWHTLLASYELTEADVKAHIRTELDVLRFLDQRFRPTVQVFPREVRRYYDDQFVPEVRKAGGQPKPLADVEPQIEQILTEQRVNELVQGWLQGLRSQAQIQYREPATVDAARPPAKENDKSDQ